MLFRLARRLIFVPLATMALGAGIPGLESSAAPWSADHGDGTYQNPILFADYSDPDVVRVGDDYYLTASSFTAAPGLPILHSRDLVNWTIIGHALARNVPEARFTVTTLGSGVWAPALRFHAGKFYLYYPDPDEGIYVVTATNAAGPWNPPVMVKAGKGLIDPCPLFDDDGKVWLVHGWARSRSGRNNLLTLVPLNAGGTQPLADGQDIILGDSFKVTTLEGPKFYHLNGWYWIFAPVGGVGGGTQAVFRSKTIAGPYEYRSVLEQGSTPTNGPHQGGLVDTPEGKEWWFIHFQDDGVYGRVTHLEPVAWRPNGWPVMGDDPAVTGTGHPVLVHAKPALPASAPAVPATSDAFDTPELGLQWQWAANPQPGWFSLGGQPRALHLVPQPKTPTLVGQPNLLLQKFPATEFRVSTQLDGTLLTLGAQAGLVVWSSPCVALAATRTAGGLSLSPVTERAGGARGARGANAPANVVVDVESPAVTLALTITRGPGTGVNSQAAAQFSYSEDGTTFTKIGPATTINKIAGAWMGAKFGLYAVTAGESKETGTADFGRVHVTALGP
jgi:beta-xylosidase